MKDNPINTPAKLKMYNNGEWKHNAQTLFKNKYTC